ncbi:f-box only protein [Anaeramoeba flamelloides]|uniref:F-box only protein n=1 Tax=Anaeramoeba flamelloides TaxID=1746091 RepID=A0AAV7ZB12_9EUKA|nr:f-box only protein [Anaeramoeba flamelloides]KAJ6240689.1 f-box only protein [Anaeramoeba flamelloides]
MDPYKVLSEELFLKILSYLDPQSLLKANLVNRAWNRMSNNDELWRDKIREIDPKISENESGWKTYYSIFRQTTNLTEKSRLIYNRNSPSLGFRILSGNSVHNNNFPAIYSYGYRENETLVVIGRGYLEEFKMSEASFAFAAYLDLLEKVGYKPQVPKMDNEETKEEEKEN